MAEKIKFATIFDMDGVLFDTMGVAHAARTNLLASYGIALTPQENENYSREFLGDNIRHWDKKYNFPLNEDEYLKAYYAEQGKIIKENGIDQGLVSLLDELDKNYILKGIGTLSTRPRAKILLKSTGLRKYFPVLVAEEDVHNHKPSSEVFLEVANRLCTIPGQCIVFEDSSNGVLAGLNANMKVIGKLNKYNSRTDLKGADKIIESFSEVNYNNLAEMFE
jgi:HAD superfamily hydrolase (TIGR01509 family)